MRTLAAKHLGASRSELAAADVPGGLALLPPLVVAHTWFATRTDGCISVEGHARCTGHPDL